MSTKLKFRGELVYGPGFNVDGIEASPDGRTLLVVQSNTARLYTVNAKNGNTKMVDLDGELLTNGVGEGWRRRLCRPPPREQWCRSGYQ